MPVGLTGCFFGLPVATLNTMMTNWTAVLTGISTAGQSYSLGGRSFTRAHISEVRQTIMEIQAALDRANGVRNTFTFANMNTGGAPATAQPNPTI